MGVIRLVLENGVRLNVDRPFDAQVLRHQSAEQGVSLPDELLCRIVRDGFVSMDHDALAAEHAGQPYAVFISPHDPSISDDLLAFLHDRLKVYLRDRGIRHDVIDACLAMPGSVT